MQKKRCFRCSTYFEEGQLLPAQDLTYQLKNYSFPIRDNMHKFILLKTIISFLNSRGGTIFIGAEDKNGQVIGIVIERKQQDQYRLFLRQLLKNIKPEIDLSQRADVVLQFFPVLKNGSFVGRYIGKITVRQGETSKLYCMTQKIQLQLTTSKKNYDQFQVIYSFERSSMGNVDKITGYSVVLKAASRAANPSQPINIFHQGCNPQPMQISVMSQQSIPSEYQASPKKLVQNYAQNSQQQVQDYSIQFFRIKDPSVRQKLQRIIQDFIVKLSIKWYIMSYEEQNDTLLIQLINKKQWSKLMDHIDANLDKINDPLKGCASFIKKEDQQDYAVYQNQRPTQTTCISAQVSQLKQQSENDKKKQQDPVKPSIQLAEEKKKEQKQDERKQQDQVSLQQQIQQDKNRNNQISFQQQIQQETSKKPKNNQHKKSDDYEIKLTSQRKQKKNLYSSSKFVSVPSSVDIQQTSVLTITHLNPARKDQLKTYVQSLNVNKKKIVQYDKTLEVHFESQEDFDNTYDKLSKSKDLTKYGFRGTLRFGINTGQITLENYNKRKYQDFKNYIEKFVGSDIKRCEFTKKGDRYSLILTLKSPEKAAKWLDKLVQDKEIKNFRIPNNESFKMKIDLVCVKPTKIKR